MDNKPAHKLSLPMKMTILSWAFLFLNMLAVAVNSFFLWSYGIAVQDLLGKYMELAQWT